MYWSKILDFSLSKLYENNGHKEFKNLTNNYERINFLLKNQFFLNQVNTYLKYIYDENGNFKSANLNDSEEKNVKLSNEYRFKGNDYYANKQSKLAFKYYTLSLMYASAEFMDNKNVDRSAILAYSNRSAVFFNEKLYQESLTDINSIKNILDFNILNKKSIEIKQDDVNDIFNLIIKLLNREANCYFHLKQLDQIEEILAGDNKFQLILKHDRFINCKSNQKMNETNLFIKSLYDKLIELPINIDNLNLNCSINDQINRISDSVDVKFSEKKGRHCISNKDIELGETIFIEEPYAAILLPEFIGQYCDFCFKKLIEKKQNGDKSNLFKYKNIEFCSICTTVLYCSNECKEVDAQSHKFECKIIKSVLHNLGIAHLAYKILIKTNINLIKKYARHEIDFNKEELINRIDYRKFDDSELNFYQVFNLMTHESNTHVNDLFKYTLTSLLLGEHYLNVETVIHDDKNELLCLISSLILRHLLQTICNAHAITQLKDDLNSNETITFDREQIRYATAIYPRVSLLNHSCDPNILSSFRQDSTKIIIKASRKIAKNDEIFNCYGPHYLKMNLFARQQSLIEQYKFKCDCIACEKQIASLDSNDDCGLRCLKCQSPKIKVLFKLNDENESKEKFKFDKILNLHCHNCQTILKLNDYTKFFDEIDSQLENLDLSSTNKSIRYLKIIIQYLEKFKSYLLIDDTHQIELRPDEKINEYFKTYYLNYSKLLDIASRLNCNIKSFDVASELTKKNILLLEVIYNNRTSNENVVEIAHELFKLAEIQCNCFKFKEALNNVNRAIALAKDVYSEQNYIMEDFIDLRNNIISFLKQ